MSHITLRTASIVLFALAFAGCGTPTVTLRSPQGDKTLTVKVEVADSQKEYDKGLMNRTSMDADAGMLFVFKSPQMLRFWMKDTKIPLDILFFDETGGFVSFAAMQPCVADPCPVYKSAALSTYALEVNKGYRDANGIGVGWKIDVEKIRKISRPT